MRGRDALFLIVGLLAGAILGLLMSGSGLIDLQGTAAVNPPVRQAFYSLDVDAVQDWLAAAYPDEADALRTAVTTAAGVPQADDFAAAFELAQPDIELIAERAFQSLTGVAPDPALAPPPVASPEGLMQSLADGPVKTCLGIDANPYSPAGPALYLALELPDTQLAQLPETWSAYRLETSKDGELFWQMLTCQQINGGSSERSR